MYGLDTLGADLEGAGFRVEERFGFTLKTVPNSMMLTGRRRCSTRSREISPELPPAMCANIGIRAVAPA